MPNNTNRSTRSVKDRRMAPRYPVSTRIFASIAGQTVRLENISRTGVAIRGWGLAAGSSHILELNLGRTHLTLFVEILDCSGDQRLHARFVDPDAGSLAQLDNYIAEYL